MRYPISKHENTHVNVDAQQPRVNFAATNIVTARRLGWKGAAGASAVACLYAVSGLAVAADPMPQRGMSGGTPATPAQHSSESHGWWNQRAASRSLAYFTDVNGADITSLEGDTIGTVADLIIDRVTFRVAGIVVSSGGVLGVGADVRVVPPDQLADNVGRDGFAARFSADDLESYPAFDEDLWSAESPRDEAMRTRLAEVALALGLPEQWGMEPAVRDDTPGHEPQHSEKARDVRGVITRMDRVTHKGEVYTIATISSGGEERPIILGPTWMLANVERTPLMGDEVVVLAQPSTLGMADVCDLTAVWIDRPGLDRITLITAGRTNADATHESTDRAGSTANRIAPGLPPRILTMRFLRASELIGATVATRDSDAGEVQDLVVNMSARHVPMIAVDPNDNFMGWGDTIRLAPVDNLVFTTAGRIYANLSDASLAALPAAPASFLGDEKNAGRPVTSVETDANESQP